MAEIISRRHRAERIEYSWDFQRVGDYKGNGFSFSTDENGNLLNMNPYAMENLEYCKTHPEEYIDEGIVTHRHLYIENATAICECGEEIELYNEYLGASECPHCGRWHNLFGQLLNLVETWADGEDW